MKTALLLLASLALLSSARPAQANEEWLTDFQKAKQIAAEKKLPILADFSGSDWCGWCIKLEREVFSQAPFKEYAQDNLILFIADFPRHKQQAAELQKQNQALSSSYSIRGFPSVLLLDASGKQLARTGYQPGGAAAYVQHLKKLLQDLNIPAAPTRD